LKIEDMKIILDQSSQQTEQQEQQFVIIQSQSLAGKAKMEVDDNVESQEEIVYLLKDENAEQPNVIQLDSNCVNQDQFVWIADQATDGSAQVPTASTIFTIKELNYSQVRTHYFLLTISSFLSQSLYLKFI
jgi:hypothetical protein